MSARADAICPADLCDAPKELWYPPTRGLCDACLAVVELTQELEGTI